MACRWDGAALSLTKYDPDWQEDREERVTRLWEAEVEASEWVSLTLAIKLSRNADEGWVELYFNGARQELQTGVRPLALPTAIMACSSNVMTAVARDAAVCSSLEHRQTCAFWLCTCSSDTRARHLTQSVATRCKYVGAYIGPMQQADKVCPLQVALVRITGQWTVVRWRPSGAFTTKRASAQHSPSTWPTCASLLVWRPYKPCCHDVALCAL